MSNVKTVWAVYCGTQWMGHVVASTEALALKIARELVFHEEPAHKIQVFARNEKL